VFPLHVCHAGSASSLATLNHPTKLGPLDDFSARNCLRIPQSMPGILPAEKLVRSYGLKTPYSRQHRKRLPSNGPIESARSVTGMSGGFAGALPIRIYRFTVLICSRSAWASNLRHFEHLLDDFRMQSCAAVEGHAERRTSFGVDDPVEPYGGRIMDGNRTHR
jgi:hypothetical protein